MLQLYNEIPYRSLDWIVENEHTFRMQPTNVDFMNQHQLMIARGGNDELARFMEMHIRPMEQKRAVLREVEVELELHRFRYDPENVSKYLGENIPADEVTGSSPDYTNALEHVFDNDPLAARITIPLSGSRSVDEQIAQLFLKEQGARVPTQEELSTEFVLHHAWPFLHPNGELWFNGQIVRKDVHAMTTVASLKGLLEPPPDIPTRDVDFWNQALREIYEWEGGREGLDFENISRRLFGHVGAVKAYTLFYPGIRYKK